MNAQSPVSSVRRNDIPVSEQYRLAALDWVAMDKADRNGNRQDREDGLGPQDESGGPEGICPKGTVK